MIASHRSIRVLVACAVFFMLGAATPAAFAQKVSRFASVKTWHGSFSFKYSANIPSSDGFDQVDMQFEGSFTVSQSAKFPTWYDGAIEVGRGHVQYRGSRKYNCTETGSFQADGPLTRAGSGSREPEVRVYVYADKWYVHFAKNMLKGALRQSGCGHDRTLDGFAAFPTDTLQFAIPATGERLDQKFAAPGVLMITPWGAPFQYGKWEAEIHLAPTRDDFVLDVTSSDYKTWRPMAAPKPQPVVVASNDALSRSDALADLVVSNSQSGNTINFTATLKRASGAPAGVGVKQMEWTLVDTSREPGESSNHPQGATDKTFDMRFAPRADQLPGDATKQTVLSGNIMDETGTATVESLDWGGWSTLRVVATLVNGTRVVGKLKETGEEDIRLPKRRKDSFIADAWRDATGARGPDDEDNEKGLGSVPGDGLTLYEEYRGFMVNNAHESGDPKKQDLFVLNEVGPRVEGGIKVFERLTGIVVHRLAAGEFDKATRLINGNMREGPNVTAQHGVLIQYRVGSVATASAEDFTTRSMTSDLPRCPGDVRYIEVPRGPVMGPAAFARDGTTPYEDVSFAHEMLHAVGVRHHGGGDYQATWDASASGASLEESVPDAGSVQIKVIGSDGRSDVTAKMLAAIKNNGTSRTVHVGVMQGESSGDDNCIMRYDANSAFRSLDPTKKNWRMLINNNVNPETVGIGICKSLKGTGINAGPSPRYGDATSGNCASQIRVRDLP